MKHPLTFPDAARFFVPLIFWAQLMMITHSVIHAWLARDTDPTVALAGFSIGFSINALLSSAFRGFHPITISFAGDRASIGRILLLGAVMSVLSVGLVLLISLTVLGDWVYGGLLGASPAVVAQARGASLLFAWIFPLQMIRNVGAGLLMQQRRTGLIATGTLLRLVSLGGWLAALSLALRGAQLGAGGLLLCVAVEAVFVVAFALPFYRERPARSGEPLHYGELWRFSWPVILNAMLENALVVVINSFLGRLARPDEALAAFGVTRGLLMVMMSPLRNLSQTAQALTHTREDLGVMLRFSLAAIGGFVGIILLIFHTPLRGLLLEGVMGLGPDLRAEVTPGLLLMVLLPPLWSAAALLRGLLSGARRTGVLAGTGFVRLGAVVSVSALTLAWPHANGALIGVLALGAAYGAEAVLLGGSLRSLLRQGAAFHPAAPDPTVSDSPASGTTVSGTAGAAPGRPKPA